MLRFEKLFQRSQGRLPVAYQATAMASHHEGLLDFDDFFDDEWMNEQVEEISIAFCNENGIEVILERPLSDKTRGGKSKKTTSKQQKAKQSKDEIQLPIFNEIGSLIREAICSMEADEMIYHMYQSDIQKLKTLDSFPLQEFIKSKFFETCKGMATTSAISPNAKETMWVKFDEIWKDEAFTESVQNSFYITKDVCSWFLFTLQQTIAKRLFTDKKPNDTITEISADEKHTVTYICGSILKKLTTKFFDLKRKTKAEIHPFLQKQIDIIAECKEVAGAVSINSNNKLIETLSRGGLVYPKKQFVEIFLEVESIFRGHVSNISRSINKEEVVTKCFEGTSISDQFFSMTESMAATDEHKCELLKSCIDLYIKIRSFGHAKNTIESYYSATQTEKKQKALRRDIKKKSDATTKSMTKKSKS
ncbi:uncharacterized protein LOC135687095 [Rhopilema esculentum]|uniref:uncharacterized protein LOC135687095 n=1 Tax=Rhopilema esculentum TaxID=499914 RepID=UPI0031D18F45